MKKSSRVIYVPGIRETAVIEAKVHLAGTKMVKKWVIIPSDDWEESKRYALKVAKTIAEACNAGKIDLSWPEHLTWIVAREILEGRYDGNFNVERGRY